MRNKGGRPRLDDPRVIVVKCLLTREEFEGFSRELLRSGLRKSEALRLLVLTPQLPKKVFGGVSLEACAAYRNLQPLQSNLNQIAHWLNSGKVQGMTHAQLVEIGEKITQISRLVRQIRHYILTTRDGQNDR